MTTAKKAYGFLDGMKLYQQRAREVLPILVRQAKAAQKIYYSDLASEIGMSNPRTLNYPLGSIGNALKSLSKEMNLQIPQIQCIVVNKGSELPGEGIGWFIDKSDFSKLNRKQRREIVNRVLSEVFAFSRWDDVLSALGLRALKNIAHINEIISKSRTYGSGGESDNHKNMKNHILNNPTLLGLAGNFHSAETEYLLPSADSIDILFKSSHDWIGVEVKSEISKQEDLLRGLFQCVKYRALLEAYAAVTDEKKDIRVLLAVGNSFPNELIPIKNILGVEVVDNIST